MLNHWPLAMALMMLVLWPTVATSADPARPLRPEDLKDNVKARYVGMKRSRGRDQHLIAKFETLGKDRKEIFVTFSHNPTIQQTTFMQIIAACAGQSTADRDSEGWVKARSGVEAIFSLPKDGLGGLGDDGQYERWYLVSLKIAETK